MQKREKIGLPHDATPYNQWMYGNNSLSVPEKEYPPCRSVPHEWEEIRLSGDAPA